MSDVRDSRLSHLKFFNGFKFKGIFFYFEEGRREMKSWGVSMGYNFQQKIMQSEF